ncbi:odorant receptor [Apis mellifera caucasica]|uniref:Odorant receptor n=1 Tax=Apis mellifera TaxID=7460 RepID=A0A7M7IFA6_APIME|nr:odorant receptor 130 isoform X1 [Apis mellifera]KAG6802038.1 odorant receptor [Apis mellifera caucasica]KAG9432379.1 odorant receptor [Apis mellifera carnica]|eukprot:XP_016767059.1 odorant receptor 130 isoform X1 [Apis mellifera]
MNVFDNQYRIYRIILKIIGLWPYDNSIYVWIQRLCLLSYFFANIIFQIVSLLRSEITLQNSILILSITCPLVLFLLRYIGSIACFPTIKIVFKHIRTEENIVQDSIESQIRMKLIDDSHHIINIFFWMTYTTIVIFIIYVSYPIILDFMIPLNESRTHFIYYITTFSHNQSIYLDILDFNFMFTGIFGLLSVACSESITGIYSYYICILLKIVSYRIQKIIMYLAMFKLSPKQIDSKLIELYRVVDIHNQTIELIDFMLSTAGIHYIIASLLVVISLAINLHRLVNATLIKKNQLEMLFCFTLVAIHLVIIFLNNYNGQIVMNSSQELFDELYNSMWYFMPLKAQKILLLIMLQSTTKHAFNILGLFTPCYAGFSTMLSSSFSYFTLMYSIQ